LISAGWLKPSARKPCAAHS